MYDSFENIITVKACLFKQENLFVYGISFLLFFTFLQCDL